MATHRRGMALAGVLALATAAGTALVSCAHPGTPGWTGGLVSPAPVQVTVNPSALPLGDAVPTGVVVGTKELILFFWGAADNPDLGRAWRDTGTGQVDEDDRIHSAVSGLSLGSGATGRIFGLDQLDAGDGTVIELGAVHGAAARIESQPPGGDPTEARYVRWSRDPGIALFWLRRAGPPVPANTPSGNGWAPGPPEWYPLVSAYDPAGHLIASARIRPAAFAPRQDG